MTSEQFDALVEQAIARLPGRFRRRLQNLVFVVEQEPPQPGLLGLYQGVPLTERGATSPVLPDQITIYQGPHERAAMSLAHLERMVEDTVLHEVAHYFGFNEQQVRRWEKRRQLWGRKD